MGAYGAEEIKTIGDAVLLRVHEADQAVQLAARLVGDYGARHRALGVRVGMHTGVGVPRDGDWFGASVNLAARIADLARAGEVLMSAETKAHAEDALLPGQLQARGRRHLKNVGEPVRVFALVSEQIAERRLPIDPVCRMAIDPELAAARIVHRGAELCFCSAACAESFRNTPERYTRRQSHRAGLLVSDDAREATARSVASAYAKGRIDAEELEDRSALVWSARTRADLSTATRDLPRRNRRRVSPLLWPIWPLVLLVRAGRRRLRLPGRSDRGQLPS